MDNSNVASFDFNLALDRALSLLTEEQRSDPVLRGQVENHLLRRVTSIVSGLMRYEEVEPLMQSMEKDLEMAPEALNEYINSHPDILNQLGQEMAHFESLLAPNLQSK